MRSIFLAAVALIATATTAAAFSVRANVASEAWMIKIKDDTAVCDLVLPGTHDAAAYNLGIPVGRDFVVAQESDITEQLTRGIRYLDFRVDICQGTTDTLCMFHGEVYLRLTFDAALNMIRQFLVQYASEAVVMRLQHEHDSGLPDFQGFVETNYLQKDPKLWFAGRGNTTATTVTVGDVRGKILLLWNSGIKTSAFGYDYALVNTRTFWEFDSIKELSDTFQKRVLASEGIHGWYENPTSGLVYMTVFGQRWFAPDAIDKTAKEMLPRVAKIWAKTPMTKGILSMDYPTDELITAFISVSLDRFSRQ